MKNRNLRSVKSLLAVLGFLFFGAFPAFAHNRTYAWNQEYRTLAQGGFEIESHTTLKVPHWDTANANSWKFQEELEYGVTDHFTIAHYEQWERKNVVGPDDATKYAGFKFESKYRMGEKGKYFADPLLYLEYEYDPRDKEMHNGLEGKIVLSKDWGKWNAVYNQIIESKVDSRGRVEHSFTLGLNYEILEGFRPGVELKGQYWNPEGHRNEIGFGPSLAYEAKYFWIATGILFGVNHAANDFESRLILGIPIG